jgi:hypothetical protein
MISLDTIVVASTTMIVGVAFLLTLRQALKLPPSPSLISSISLAIVFFALAAFFPVLDTMGVLNPHVDISKLSGAFFGIGLLLVLLVVLRIDRPEKKA